MAIFGPHAIELGNVDLTQCTDVQLNPGLTQAVVRAGGQVNPTFIATSRAAPVISFTTTEIKRVLDKMATPWNGLAVDSEVGDDPINVYFQKHTEFGTRYTDSTFVKIAITDCIVVPRTLTAADGQPATIACDIVPAKLLGINAVLVTSGQSSPGITMAVNQVWTAGPIKINTASLAGTDFMNVQNITLDFGIQLNQIFGEGAIYAHFVGIQTREPRITVQLTDETALLQLLSTGEVTGVEQGATDSTVYLRKMEANAGMIADNVAEHISFTIDDGKIYPESFGASGPTPVQTGIVLHPAYDGSAPIIAVDTATTVT